MAWNHYSIQRGPLEGRFKEPGIAAFIRELAFSNPGLCVVTSRERIADLVAFEETGAPRINLEDLRPEVGVALLRRIGVKGKEQELLAAVESFEGNALALTLIGAYLKRAWDGDVRKLTDVQLATVDKKQGGHAFRVIAAYERLLGDGPELAILKLLGFFDRPADVSAIAALRAKPVIPGLTDHLVEITEEDWRWTVSGLRENGLLASEEHVEMGTLDTHPLVRAYFAKKMEEEWSEAWRQGNLRLYSYFSESAPEYPDTLEELQPLYLAVVHGCRAGLVQEAFQEVFWARIQRGDSYYSTKKLGAFGSELIVLSGFFDSLWGQPSSRLNPEAQAWVLDQAGLVMRALGRLQESVQLTQAGLSQYARREKWLEASISAGSISGVLLTLGDVSGAVKLGREAVRLADLGNDIYSRMITRTVLADALHQIGQFDEAAEIFAQAESMQAERRPQYPLLYTVQGYQYCDLMFSLSEPLDGSGVDGLMLDPGQAREFGSTCMEVIKRTKRTMEWVDNPSRDILSAGFEHLALGRAYLGLSLVRLAEGERLGGLSELTSAEVHLDQGVSGLRQAVFEEYLTCGLLVRAAYRRIKHDIAGAERDLSEAKETAGRGSMRLLVCNACLEWVRFHLANGDFESARFSFEEARKLVDDMGYARRKRDIEYLATRIY